MRTIIIYIVFFLFVPFILINDVSANDEKLDSLTNVAGNLQDKDKVPVLINIMRLQFQMMHDDDAFNTSQEALELAIKYDLETKIADIYLFLSEYYSYSDKQKEIKYAEMAYNLANEINYFRVMAAALNRAANFYLEQNMDTAMIIAEKSIEIAKDHQLVQQQAEAEKSLGMYYYNRSVFDEALNHWKRSLELFKQINNLSSTALVMNNIGVIYRRWGEYITAIEYYQKALQIQEELNNEVDIARSLANIGNVYYDYGIELDKAIEYYSKAEKLFTELGDSIMAARIKFNVAYTFVDQKKYEEALQATKECLEDFENLDFKQGIAEAYQNIAEIYKIQGDYAMAIDNLNMALELNESLDDKLNLVYVYLGIGEIYLKMDQCQKALKNLNTGIKYAKELNLKSDLIEYYRLITDGYECIGNLTLALDYFKQYDQLKDTLFKEDYTKQVNELQAKFETRQKEQEIKTQKLQLEKQALANKRQRVIIFFAAIFIVMFTVFSFILFRQFNALKKANHLLYQQNEEITQQRDQISEQAQEIRSSIQYASTIQSASLPPNDLFDELFKEHLTFFKPRDIVSGDFYWLSEVDDKIVITAADCTGHGVPGAFMSMMGMSLLNEIVNRSRVIDAAEILTQMKDNIIKALHQYGSFDSIHDGMDMALCVIDKDMKSLQYSGAYNPLLIVRDKELISIKATRRPVSYYERNVNFENNDIPLQENDCLYMFSDGYSDQFGGPRRKKFMMRRFKELLININHLPMNQQKQEIAKTFDDWKKDSDQVDDVLVLGIRI